MVKRITIGNAINKTAFSFFFLIFLEIQYLKFQNKNRFHNSFIFK